MTLYRPSSLANLMSESFESNSLMRVSILGLIYDTKSLWFWTLELQFKSTKFDKSNRISFFFTLPVSNVAVIFSKALSWSIVFTSFSNEAMTSKVEDWNFELRNTTSESKTSAQAIISCSVSTADCRQADPCSNPQAADQWIWQLVWILKLAML